MAFEEGFTLTDKGRDLLAKAQTGVLLKFNRIAVGDGELGITPIKSLNALISEKKTLGIGKLKFLTGGKSVVGTVLSNQEVTVGFYYRELGVFAQDPDLGEILYCYANAGASAEFIAPGGGAEIIEKYIDAIMVVGNATNVSAVIDESLIFATKDEVDDALAEAKQYTDNAVISIAVPVRSVNGKTGDVSLTKTDMGLGNVDNIQQATKTEFTAHDNNTTRHTTSTEKSSWNNHLTRSDNPHNTTKAHVGLGNVDNIQQATKAEFNTHNNDNTRHVTTTERNNWNAKETTAGAQQRADNAYNAAVLYANGIHDQLFGYVSSGKNGVAAAITDMGVPTSGSDLFATMEANIRAIRNGLKFAKLTQNESGSGSSNYNKDIYISGLSFTPQFVFLRYSGSLSVSGGGGNMGFDLGTTIDANKFPANNTIDAYANSYRVNITAEMMSVGYGGCTVRLNFKANFSQGFNGQFQILVLGE